MQINLHSDTPYTEFNQKNCPISARTTTVSSGASTGWLNGNTRQVQKEQAVRS